MEKELCICDWIKDLRWEIILDYPDEPNDIMIEVLIRDMQESLRMGDNGSEFESMYFEGGGRDHKPRKTGDL